jgi:hypothetical protein
VGGQERGRKDGDEQAGAAVGAEPVRAHAVGGIWAMAWLAVMLREPAL